MCRCCCCCLLLLPLLPSCLLPCTFVQQLQRCNYCLLFWTQPRLLTLGTVLVGARQSTATRRVSERHVLAVFRHHEHYAFSELYFAASNGGRAVQGTPPERAKRLVNVVVGWDETGSLGVGVFEPG